MSSAKGHTPYRGGRSPETLEDNPNSLRNLGQSFMQEAGNAVTKFGGDFFDQFFGNNAENKNEQTLQNNPEQQQTFRPVSNERITIFSLREQRESREIQQIKELLKQIKQEIKAIKAADAALKEQLKDAEKLTIEVDPKAGIYHINFLEVVLKLLHTARTKIGESSAWLSAMQSKKSKRGSAFAARSKKHGTQYSQSQELTPSRAIQ
jgi:vacuolar-type H+-ATPase subunit I/STV1